MQQYEPAHGVITRAQLESAIHEFRRRETTWSSTSAAAATARLRVLVARGVPLELWDQSSKLLQASAFPEVFFEAEFADAGAGTAGDSRALADVYIGKVVSAAHEEIRRCIAQDISSSLSSEFILDLPSAPVLIAQPGHSHSEQRKSILKRADIAIRPRCKGYYRPELEQPDSLVPSSSPHVVVDIEDHHSRPQDSLEDLSDAYFRAIPTLRTAVFVRIFRRRVSRRFACVAVVMQRSAAGDVGGVVVDAVGFGSCPLTPRRVVNRIRQLTMAPFTQPIPREIYPLATHERIASNPWAMNPSNAHNRPFITIQTSSAESKDGRHHCEELQILLWPIYQAANARVPM